LIIEPLPHEKLSAFNSKVTSFIAMTSIATRELAIGSTKQPISAVFPLKAGLVLEMRELHQDSETICFGANLVPDQIESSFPPELPCPFQLPSNDKACVQ
jgi:hypothetical protein